MHDHHSGHRFGSRAEGLAARRADSRRRLRLALGINLAMLVAEAVGGFITGSLALLADAGHVLSDVGSIALALAAAALAARPGTARRTFGYQRSEVLAAFANGLLLVAVAVLIGVAAVGRLADPPEIEAGGVLGLGVFGLVGNVVATVVLMGGRREDVNLEGALRHSAADALGSIGVVVAGAVVLLGGSPVVDPLIGLAIAGLVVASSWRLIREPLDVLMEADPADLDVEEIGAAICGVEDVRAVHDLHVWAVTAGFGALAAHVVVAPGTDRDLALRRLEVMLNERFGIDHTTLQMEEEASTELLEVENTPPEA